MSEKQRRLFVIMPFGVRTVERNGVRSELDFDRVYQNLIKPAGIHSGYEVLRIDEVHSPGRISDQYFMELYTADVVLGDISAPNANVFYELGVRQAMNACPTVLIAIDGVEIPFDFRDQRILFYDALSFDISQDKLSTLIKSLDHDRGRNPVQEFLIYHGIVSTPETDITAFEQEFRGRIDRARNVEQLIGVWGWAQHLKPLPPFALVHLADRLSEVNEWALACDVIIHALKSRPKDFEIHRRLGWYLRNRGEKHYDNAEKSFRRALELNPSDPETIGMLAGLLKRQERFSESAELYSQGATLSPNNLYMKVNQAAAMILSSPTEPESAIKLYDNLYQDLTRSGEKVADEWTHLVCGEAAFVIGDQQLAKNHFSRAHALSTSPINILSPADQLELFGKLGFRTDDAMELAVWIRSLRDNSDMIGVQASGEKKRDHGLLPVVIHLSDIHFGTRLDKDGNSVCMHRFKDGDYSLPLFQHMQNEFTEENSYFKFEPSRIVLVVSGDLTYTATLSEFEEANNFLESFCRDLGISKERVVISPGNHDVDWASSAIDPTRRFDNYLSFLRMFYGKQLFEELYPLIKWDFTVAGKRPLPTDIISIIKFDDVGIHFVSFNSCVYETPEHHYGFVSGKQIRNAEMLIQKLGLEKSNIICAVMHHHLHPYPEPVVLVKGNEHWHDQSTIRDGALVERFLERAGFDVVFHGHKHKAQVRETIVRDPSINDDTPPLIVFGGGSCGVESKELEHSIPNHYEVLEFLSAYRKRGAQFIKLDWREIAIAPGADWTTPKRWILMG